MGEADGLQRMLLLVSTPQGLPLAGLYWWHGQLVARELCTLQLRGVPQPCNGNPLVTPAVPAVPSVCSALLDGAQHVVLDGVFHRQACIRCFLYYTN